MKALPSVLVDNTAGSHAADVEGCGLPDKPCLTIDYGVQCALAATSGDEVAEVHVQGPGPYNGTSGDGRGIVIPNNSTSLVVVGLNVSRDGGTLVGAPVIDCEGQGRALAVTCT